MQSTASRLKLGDAESQQRLETLPLLMKGHLAELKGAIDEMFSKKEGQEVRWYNFS
jgi:hypothetical protein